MEGIGVFISVASSYWRQTPSIDAGRPLCSSSCMNPPTITTLPLVKSEVLRTENGIYLTATCGKVTAIVGITVHGTQVLCLNASHRAFQRSGRRFRSTADALAAYKSPEMRTIILAADKLNA